MPNRLIFSLRYANKIFLRFLFISLVMIFFMSLLRLNLYFLSIHFKLPEVDWADISHGFVMGLRFDTSVMAYVFVPALALLSLQGVWEWWPAFTIRLYKTYWILIWIGISVLSFVDFVFFSQKLQRIHGAMFSALTFDDFLEALGNSPLNHVLIFSVVILLLMSIGIIMVKELKFGFWKDEYSPDKGSRTEVALRLVLPLILITLAARGTLSYEPLNADDSQISKQKVINEMSLNPIWCLLGP